MQIGLIGLGKMGFNLALKFKKSGHQVLAYDLSKSACERIRQHGIATALSVSDLILSLSGRRVIWMMVPAGHAVDVILSNLKNHFNFPKTPIMYLVFHKSYLKYLIISKYNNR